MRVRHRTTSGQEKIELQMTPMIDIVFQLLVFFIMTFKIASQEGDFNIKMPLAAPSAGSPDEIDLPPIKIRLETDGTGVLTRLSMDGRVLPYAFNQTTGRTQMDALRNEVIALIGDERGPGSYQENAEVELDCDFGLNYIYVIEAITAVSGYVDVNGNLVKLVEKIKFAPPRSG